MNASDGRQKRYSPKDKQDHFQFGEANEENESEYYTEVNQILNQVEIYDQVWHVRHRKEEYL